MPEPELPSRRALLFPLCFAAMLASFAAVPSLRESQRVAASFLVTAAILTGWTLALWLSAARRGRSLTTRFVLRRPHWLQPLVQGSVYVYWGWHWSQVGASAHFIVAQIFFAYAFDMLLAWSRRDDYELGFGPFPIILSINLFLWFKPDWFCLQFVMLAVGFGAKQLLRWTKDGRESHIFNPSSFPLAIVSVVLLFTGTTDLTWGNEIALSLEQPRHIYELLFLISIPGQLLFGVASMTMPAVLTAWGLGALYTGFTGTYFFFGPVPAAAFLGMLLLFTDPATAPRSELGRVMYGMLYGASVFVLFGLLDLTGQPRFYDKLLFVPFLNLSVRALDRLAKHPLLARLDPARLLPSLDGRQRNLALTGTWTVLFVALLAAHGLGDTHPANRLPFWEEACAQGRRNACRQLATMEGTFCDRGSAWACNELGIRSFVDTAHSPEDRKAAAGARFSRSCALGSKAGCANQESLQARGPLRHDQPGPEDFEILLEAKALPQGRGQDSPLDLARWACEQGFREGCFSAEQMASGASDPARRTGDFAHACAAGDLRGCRGLGLMYRRGDGVQQDDRRAMVCELGVTDACIAGLVR